MSDFFTTDLSFLGVIDEVRDQRPSAPCQYQPHSLGGIKGGSIAGIRFRRAIDDATRAKISAANKGRKRPDWVIAKMKAGHEAAKQRRLESMTPEQREAFNERQAKYQAKRQAYSASPYVKTPEHRAKISAARLGRRVSDETRAKMSASHKGKTVSVETRAKIRDAQRAAYGSDEHRAKMSAARKGRIISDETRARQSAAMKGRFISDEHRAKMSAALTAKWQDPDWVAKQLASRRSRAKAPAPVKVKLSPEEFSARMSQIHKGKTVSAETRAKMSAARKGHRPGVLSEEGRAKIVAACRKPKSAETRAKISAAVKLKHKLKKAIPK